MHITGYVVRYWAEYNMNSLDTRMLITGYVVRYWAEYNVTSY